MIKYIASTLLLVTLTVCTMKRAPEWTEDKFKSARKGYKKWQRRQELRKNRCVDAINKGKDDDRSGGSSKPGDDNS